MNIGMYGILFVFGLFVVLLIFNPKMSCFGRKIKSPFYPILRKRGRTRTKPTAQDLGFDLGGKGREPSEVEPQVDAPPGKPLPTQDYGFHLDDESSETRKSVTGSD